MSTGERLRPFDRACLQRAIELATRGAPYAHPNPLVGAVVAANGEVLGEGYHARCGGPHGEIEAMAAVPEPRLLRGSTVYVNLEPCAHHGRTAPCVEALIAAGVARVVCSHRDPNRAARGGVEQLRNHGVQVDLVTEFEEERRLVEPAVALNARFLWAHGGHQGPLVTLKWAMTLDGKIATVADESQWISGSEGRAWALALRDVHDAILVGSGTVLADDPRLNRRTAGADVPSGEGAVTKEAFVRVVMDRRLRTPPTAKLFSVPGPVVVVTEMQSLTRWPDRRNALEAAGAEVVALDTVTPENVCRHLGERGVESLLVEGGAQIHGAFVDAGLMHRVGVCIAPRLVGGADARSAVGGGGIERLEQSLRLGYSSITPRGCDWILEGVEERCLRDLLSNVA